MMTLPLANPPMNDAPSLAPLDTAQPEALGHVTSVRGSQASVGLPTGSADVPEEARATVGKFRGCGQENRW